MKVYKLGRALFGGFLIYNGIITLSGRESYQITRGPKTSPSQTPP